METSPAHTQHTRAGAVLAAFLSWLAPVGRPGVCTAATVVGIVEGHVVHTLIVRLLQNQHCIETDDQSLFPKYDVRFVTEKKKKKRGQTESDALRLSCPVSVYGGKMIRTDEQLDSGQNVSLA